MRDGQMISAALNDICLAKDELRAKLSEPGVTDVSRVRAVVLEMTGDFSIIEGRDVRETLLYGVRRVD